MSKTAAITTLILALAAGSCLASSRLFYLEAQAVGWYDFHYDRFHYFSADPMDAMQKPSIGFDFIQRLSGTGGDWGMLAVQSRLSYDDTRSSNIEPQLYNAYLKVKPGFGDIWIGHNKPAFGLSSYLDNHGTLLQPFSMAGLEGYSFDRDWGIGYYRDFDWGDLSASATLGSGMPLIMRGNRLFSARVAKGNLNQDNYTVGLSASYGKILFWTMGYHTIDNLPPIENYLLGADATVLWNRFESRSEIIGQAFYMPWVTDAAIEWHAFERFSLNLMEDNRLRLEVQLTADMMKSTQYQYMYMTGVSNIGSYAFSMDHPIFGVSYALNEDFTFRLIFNYVRPAAVAQLYWYHKL